MTIKALTALVSDSLSVGCENGPERGFKVFSYLTLNFL